MFETSACQLQIIYNILIIPKHNINNDEPADFFLNVRLFFAPRNAM